MATNPYIVQGVASEQNLFEDLIIESIKFYGQDLYYIPREIINRDLILNEDVESRFSSAYLIEMYIENTEGYEGGNILGKFGLEIRDDATFIVAKKIWETAVNGTDLIRPNEGDLIYIPLSKSFFEIAFVEHESPFYQLNNLPTYKMQCNLFTLSDEDFNTGITDIDSIEESAFTFVMTLKDVVGTFLVGEKLINPDGISGDILSIDGADITLNNIATKIIDGLFYDFKLDDVVSGNLSGATAIIESIANLTNETILPNESNLDFETIGNSIIDFSESNPFGEPRE